MFALTNVVPLTKLFLAQLCFVGLQTVLNFHQYIASHMAEAK